jgi:hypothetical protein
MLRFSAAQEPEPEPEPEKGITEVAVAEERIAQRGTIFDEVTWSGRANTTQVKSRRRKRTMSVSKMIHISEIEKMMTMNEEMG